MNIETAAAIAGNAAVVASLFYLARQIRLQRRTSIWANSQSLVESLNSIYMQLATSDDLAHIYTRGRRDPSSLDEKERARFFYVCVAWFCHHEQSFLQCHEKLMPKTYFDSWDVALKEDLKDPGFIEFWAVERLYFDDPFREYVDRVLDEVRSAS